MPSFNLIHEPWLPVRLHDGAVTTLNLRDVLVRAHNVQELATDSPLETIALNRFLLAVTHHAFPELANEKDWLRVYHDEAFPADRLDTYFRQYEDTFDLLHPERPFYQHPEPLVSSPSPIARLFSEAASGNNPTLFSHDLDDAPEALPLDVVARGLVCTQATALGGGVSKPFYLSHAPLVGMAIFWMRGAALFQALLLNLPPAGVLSFWRSNPKDAPAWARDLTPTDEQIRPPLGLLDYLTWQSRRLRLDGIEKHDGRLVAAQIWVSQGDKADPMPFEEPMAAYVGSVKKGTFPLSLDKDRALWRDAHAFLGRPDTASGRAGHPPRTLEWAANSEDELGEETARNQPMDADVFGMVNDKAKLELWRRERFPVYLSFLRENDDAAERRQASLAGAIAHAEAQARGPLRDACFTFARRMRFPGHDGDRLGAQERDEVNAFVKALGADRLYWSSLETSFFPFLGDLAQSETPEEVERTVHAWRRIVVRTVFRVFQGVTYSLGETAHTFQARAEGENVLHRAYSKPTALPS